MGAGEQILHAVEGVLAAVVRVEGKIDRLLDHLGANRSASNGAGKAGTIATVAQIQGQYGDFEVKLEPNAWTGPSQKGRFVSECPPDYLDMLATMLDDFADSPRPGKEKWAKNDRLNAARARRWAIEIREGRYKQDARGAAPPPPSDDREGTTWSHGAGGPPPPSDDGMPPPPFGDDDQTF